MPPSDVLNRIEVNMPLPLEPPTILPYGSPSLGAGAGPAGAMVGGTGGTVERFWFPELPEPREDQSASASPRIVWPECGDRQRTSAHEATADAIFVRLPLRRNAVLAFTSPGDGDGKTGLVIALAPHLANRSARGILAVDANYRKPDLSVRLGVEASEVGAGQALIYPTNLPRLNVLPACRCGDPAWIEELREGWPLVLLDAASLAHSEVMPIVRCCDGVCLVVRLGHTARRAVADAARLIRDSGGRLLGCATIE